MSPSSDVVGKRAHSEIQPGAVLSVCLSSALWRGGHYGGGSGVGDVVSAYQYLHQYD